MAVFIFIFLLLTKIFVKYLIDISPFNKNILSFMDRLDSALTWVGRVVCRSVVNLIGRND